MKSSPTKLVRRRGWIPVSKADIALLIEQCGGSAATTCATWIALLIIGNDRRTNVFKVGINVIRYLAGPSLRTVKTALSRLAELEFIKIEANRVAGSKERDASTYILLRGAQINRGKSGNNCTTSRANDKALQLHGDSKESASALEESASAREELATAGSSADATNQQASSIKRSNGHPRKW